MRPARPGEDDEVLELRTRIIKKTIIPEQDDRLAYQDGRDGYGGQYVNGHPGMGKNFCLYNAWKSYWILFLLFGFVELSDYLFYPYTLKHMKVNRDFFMISDDNWISEMESIRNYRKMTANLSYNDQVLGNT